MNTTTCPFGENFDFTDPDVLLAGLPVTQFAELRRTAPVWWNEQPESIFGDGGYWVISRHEDVRDISRNSELWSTNRNGAVMRLPDGVTADQLELTKALLVNHDAPEHTRLRKLVSRLFTPRAIAQLEEKLGGAAAEIVRSASLKEDGNFVDDIAMNLPLLAIADLIGVPEADRAKLFDWTNAIMNTDDPDFAGDPTVANAELMAYAYNMADERRRCPAQEEEPARPVAPPVAAHDLADDDDWVGVEGLKDLDPVDAQRVIADRLCSRIAAIMGYADHSALDLVTPMIELGMDSLMAVRMRQASQADLGVEPPVALLLGGASVSDITANVVRQLGVAVQSSTASVNDVRDRASQRAAARRGAAMRRKRGQHA